MIIEELIELLIELPKTTKIKMDGIQFVGCEYESEEWDAEESDFQLEDRVKNGPFLVIRGWRYK